MPRGQRTRKSLSLERVQYSVKEQMEGLIKQEYQEIPEYEVLRPATGCFQCQGLSELDYSTTTRIIFNNIITSSYFSGTFV